MVSSPQSPPAYAGFGRRLLLGSGLARQLGGVLLTEVGRDVASHTPLGGEAGIAAGDNALRGGGSQRGRRSAELSMAPKHSTQTFIILIMAEIQHHLDFVTLCIIAFNCKQTLQFRCLITLINSLLEPVHSYATEDSDHTF